MKVGDLVKWTCPAAEAFGIVMTEPKENRFWDSLAVYITWLDGKHDGEYPIDHKFLELISEAREQS